MCPINSTIFRKSSNPTTTTPINSEAIPKYLEVAATPSIYRSVLQINKASPAMIEKMASNIVWPAYFFTTVKFGIR
ncbi:MAG TPA: hypothetical protein DIT97_04705 [Gimesia maris]|uniref:Uncharacterized protein n=1 Tax=Gimesia maris TaxID=122 RepID=A0A3D3R0K1_9PLAN|nr:hypothetical protein [Gimesia maris]